MSSLGLRPDLDALAEKSSTRKGILGMPDDERHRLMDVLLHISNLALAAFDVIEADACSERDAVMMLQLPDYCNAFGDGIRKHAARKMGLRPPAHNEDLRSPGGAS